MLHIFALSDMRDMGRMCLLGIKLVRIGTSGLIIEAYVRKVSEIGLGVG